MKLGVQLTCTVWVSLHGRTPTAVPLSTNGFFGKWFASGADPGYPRPPIEECLPFDFTTQLRRMRI